jgi:predicted permease
MRLPARGAADIYSPREHRGGFGPEVFENEVCMYKFGYSLSIISFGLLLGYSVQVFSNRGILRLPVPIEELRKLLQRVALLVVNPVAILGAVWVVNVSSIRLVALPFIGFFALLAGGLLGLLAARLLQLPARKAGALFGCGSFTNIGSVGALVCFVFLGEPGFALVPIYKLFEELFYYGVGFPIAKFYSSTDTVDKGTSARISRLLLDPFILTALSSIVIGGFLNLSGLNRPAFYGPLNSFLVPLGTVMLLASIGLAMRFRRVRNYLRESAAVAVIKFALVPALAFTAAFGLGLGDIEGGLPLKVVLILSSMPVAFNALIPPSIYDLDLDLANSCWFVTTALLVVVLPVLLSAVQSL